MLPPCAGCAILPSSSCVLRSSCRSFQHNTDDNQPRKNACAMVMWRAEGYERSQCPPAAFLLVTEKIIRLSSRWECNWRTNRIQHYHGDVFIQSIITIVSLFTCCPCYFESTGPPLSDAHCCRLHFSMSYTYSHFKWMMNSVWNTRYLARKLWMTALVFWCGCHTAFQAGLFRSSRSSEQFNMKINKHLLVVE